MGLNNFVSASVLLANNSIKINGETVFESRDLSATDFLVAAYHHFKINYPKFFKMDNLCKTGFIAAELLLNGRNISAEYTAEEVGIIVSNANSSLDTDIKYNASIATAPSPALFVYTLPNVLIGELCIRHRIKGEAACFVFDIFDCAFQTSYVNSLMDTGNAKATVSGWADYYNGKAEAFFYLAEQKENGGVLHDFENVKRLFETNT